MAVKPGTIPDDVFVETWRREGNGPRTAKALGISERWAHTKRRQLSARGYDLPTRPEIGYERNVPDEYRVTQWTFPREKKLEIDTGAVVVFSDAHYWPGEPSVAHRARYQRNPDAKRIYAKAYAQLHPEKVVNNSRAWRRKHPEQRSAILKNYRALRRAITSEGMSAAALRAWTALQEKVCAWCGIECADNFHVDHVIPLSRGGPHEAENLTIACPRCNLRKNSKMPDDFRGAVA